MRRVEVDPAIREGLKLDFPKRDIEAIYARFQQWAESREVYAPVKAFRAWVENAERDNLWRRGAASGPSLPDAPIELGERSDPAYAAFRIAVIEQIMDKGLKPRDVAELLAQHYDKFCDLPHKGHPGGLGWLLTTEIADLRARGDRW